jgi:hypothetical protein
MGLGRVVDVGPERAAADVRAPVGGVDLDPQLTARSGCPSCIALNT